MMSTPNMKNKKSFSEIGFAWLLCFTLIFQGIAPAYAWLRIVPANESIPNSTIEAYLNNEPGIVPDWFQPYKPNEALRFKAPNATSITSFFELLQASAPEAIAPVSTSDSSGEKIDAEVAQSGKTIRFQASAPAIAPVIRASDLPSGKIGDEVVQSRLIRTQLQILIGRSLLNKVENPLPIKYTSEEAQIQGLYQNAFNLLSSELSGRTFGQNLNLNPVDSGLSQPIVWPESRTIRGKANVLVPVVYLPKNYYDTLNVTTNVFESKGYITLSNLIIENAIIRLGQQTYIDVTNDIINNSGTIRGEADLAITAGKAFKNLGGTISAYDDLRIGAHSFENQTLLYQFDTEVGTSTIYGQIAGLGSDTGDITVRSYSDIVFLGSEVTAPDGAITLTADGDIRLDSGELVNVESERFGSGTKTTSEVTYLTSTISAKDTIELIAGGRILIEGANIHSDQGHIKILSGLGITILDETGVTQSQASGKFGKREMTESVYQTVAIRSILDAGKGVKLHTDLGGITLRAVDISSTEGTTVNAQNGTVKLLTTVETDHYAYSSVNEGLFTTKTKNEGRNIETGVPNTIVGGFAVEAASAIQVEYTGNPDLTLDEQIAELAKMPGMEWMETVRGNSVTPDIDWSLIELQYETWNESNTSLSPAFAAVIAIGVAILSQDYSGQLATTLLSGATQGATHAAIQAGITSFISQATLAAGNGLVNGDIVGAMEDFASDDTLKTLAVSMVTAGAIHAVDAKFFNYINPEGIPLDQLKGIQESVSLANQATQAITHAAVKASVETIIQGGGTDSLFEDFMTSLANTTLNIVSKEVAGKISVGFDDKNITEQIGKYFAHAAAGCVIGITKSEIDGGSTGNDCASGAGGAVVGELVAETYKDIITPADNQTIQDYRENGIDFAKISVALTAMIARGDVNIAVYTGENAAANNALSVKQIVEGSGDIIKCAFSTDPDCTKTALLLMTFRYYEQQDALRAGIGENFEERLNEVLQSPEAAAHLAEAFRTAPIETAKMVIENLGTALSEIPGEIKEDFEAVSSTFFSGSKPEDFNEAGNAMADLLVASAGLILTGGTANVAANTFSKTLNQIIENARKILDNQTPETRIFTDYDSPNTGVLPGSADSEAGIGGASLKESFGVPKDMPPLHELTDIPGISVDRQMHVLNAQVKTKSDGTVTYTGGHWLGSSNIQPIEGTAIHLGNGVISTKIKIKNPDTGEYVMKTNNNGIATLFPADWDSRKAMVEAESALNQSSRVGNTNLYEGTSPSGVKIIFVKPNGNDVVTFYPSEFQ